MQYTQLQSIFLSDHRDVLQVWLLSEQFISKLICNTARPGKVNVVVTPRIRCYFSHQGHQSADTVVPLLPIPRAGKIAIRWRLHFLAGDCRHCRHYFSRSCRAVACGTAKKRSFSSQSAYVWLGGALGANTRDTGGADTSLV